MENHMTYRKDYPFIRVTGFLILDNNISDYYLRLAVKYYC